MDRARPSTRFQVVDGGDSGQLATQSDNGCSNEAKTGHAVADALDKARVEWLNAECLIFCVTVPLFQLVDSSFKVNSKLVQRDIPVSLLSHGSLPLVSQAEVHQLQRSFIVWQVSFCF